MITGRLLEARAWMPVHGANLRCVEVGEEILRDHNKTDYCLIRLTDQRLNTSRLRLQIITRAAESCDTHLYVHHWGNKDICSVGGDGTVISNEGAETIQVERLSDGFLNVIVLFQNRHPTVSVGCIKPGTQGGVYHGTGVDQWIFKRIDVEILPGNLTRLDLVHRIYKNNDPFQGFPANLLEYDLQGWNSQHHYLRDTIERLRPSIIVEIGVWKGGSTVFMANELKQRALTSVVIAVDSWLGSSEHWLGLSLEGLSPVNGHSSLYQKFLSNVIRSDVVDYVVPLPIDSLNAAELLKQLNITPDMIHLDGGHDYESVSADLRVWWPLLAPGGILIGDDYYNPGPWATVRSAFDNFFASVGLPIEYTEGKCRIQKPI